MQSITGNTYPVREQIKSIGGKWNAAEKCWMVPDENAAAARSLVGTPTTTAPKSSFMRCKCCGQTGSRGAYPFSTAPGTGRCDDCV